MKPREGIHPEEIRRRLEQDRIWAAYALADLDPEHQPFTEWLIDQGGILMIYRGLDPPILFAMGQADPLSVLLARIPTGKYQISFPEAYIGAMPAHVAVLEALAMWRMWIQPKAYPLPPDIQLVHLGSKDQPSIDQLYAGQPDAPDGYHPRQLTLGPFVGVWEEGRLVASAGVHVLSKAQSIAAIGNIFTHPEWRGQGFARACIVSLLSSLYELGIKTTVLNVGQGNRKAVALYTSLGFEVHCPFFEGQIMVHAG